jgi:hypothetical protein
MIRTMPLVEAAMVSAFAVRQSEEHVLDANDSADRVR